MRLRLLTLLVAAFVIAGGTGAQKVPPGLQPLPEPPPAPPGGFDPSLEPQVTIKKRDGDTVEEFRVGGRLVMIKVTPAHGIPYILTDPKGDGSFTNRRASLEDAPSVPMWTLFTF